MKKKYREITVDGEKYAWMFQDEWLRIWKDKKLIHQGTWELDSMTPGIVARAIKNFKK